MEENSTLVLNCDKKALKDLFIWCLENGYDTRTEFLRELILINTSIDITPKHLKK